jgi:hypothetical protein
MDISFNLAFVSSKSKISRIEACGEDNTRKVKLPICSFCSLSLPELWYSTTIISQNLFSAQHERKGQKCEEIDTMCKAVVTESVPTAAGLVDIATVGFV